LLVDTWSNTPGQNASREVVGGAAAGGAAADAAFADTVLTNAAFAGAVFHRCGLRESQPAQPLAIANKEMSLVRPSPKHH
jgi:hypothetical protein